MQGADFPLRGFAVALGVFACALGFAQDRDFRLIQEAYFDGGSGVHGLHQTATWTELHVTASPSWSGVFSDFHYGNDGMLDEDYVQYDGKSYALRAGRMRSAFGFGAWSDLWYNPVFSEPIARFMPLASGVDLSNFNSGLEARAWRGNVQAEFAVLNAAPGEEQVLPGKMDFDRARVQLTQGKLILGLNVLAQDARFSGDSARAFGVDYRLTAPRLVLRGEAVEGLGNGVNGKGYYADATYRAPKFFRTELGGRIEGYRADAGLNDSTLYTLGARQILTPNLALTLDYSWGHVPDFLYSMRGWHLQASVGVRFE